MARTFIVTGTDTDIGKTVFASAVAGALDGFYWKPVQAGMDGMSDRETAEALSGLDPSRILHEAYRLTTACSPHRAAEIDGITIDPHKLTLPHVNGPLIIETAGGVLVPLTDDFLFADLMAQWRCPVILVARTVLGTINHSLLSIEALRSRGIEIHGVAFIGEANENSEATIAHIGKVKRLGRLPLIRAMDSTRLRETFLANFSLDDFR
jgi:dethiobiotin synthetase